MTEGDARGTLGSADDDQGAPFRAARQEPLLTRAFPVVADFRRYRVPSVKRDVLAGVTVAALAIPSAMTYAEVAGLSPVNGLYALLLPTVLYVLLGSSRQLIVGPEGSISTLVGAAILPLAVAGSAHAGELAAMLAVLVAICFAVAWTLRLGWIADYFSRAVLLGYIHGVAVVLVICQVGRLFGVSIAATNPLKLPLAAVLARVVGLVAVAGILRGDQALVPRAARNLLVDARCGWPIAV